MRSRSGSSTRAPLDVVLVEPDMVAEIDVDVAQDHGAWPHPVRPVRIREGHGPGDVAAFGGRGAVR